MFTKYLTTASLLLFLCQLGYSQTSSVLSTLTGMVASTDEQPVEVGFKFRATQPGSITAIRFYKFTANTGTHIGSIWTSSGGLLGRVTFTNETASGWQRMAFATPVPVTPNTVYVASYYAPAGGYARTLSGFTQSLSSPDGNVVGLSNAEATGNGLYRYGGNAFPTGSYQATNYWVDVEFTAANDASDATPTSLFKATDDPAVNSSDASAVELGMKFRATTGGIVNAIRFYKAPGNTGTHVGSLWTSTGQLLARVNFANETSSGWQQATLTAPVTLSPDATYIVSYFAPNGRYSKNEGFFNSRKENGSLQGLANGEDGANGLYSYRSSAGFPTGSHQSTNYWVDVVFVPNGLITQPPAGIFISISPSSVALLASQSRQFTAAVSGSSNTAVTWSLSPSVGSISASGLYTAPSQISSSQAVTVTATSQADTSKKATAAITLNPATATDTTLPSVSMTSPTNGATVSGTVTLSAAASDNVGVTTVQFQVNGSSHGPALTSGPYSTTWNTSGLSNGSYTVSAIARDAAGNSRTASLALTVSNVSVSKINLPVEVLGANGTTKSVQFNMPSGVTASTLYLQIHGLSYDGQASVQINNGSWLSITGNSANIDPLAVAYGGIGGGFHTIKLTVPVSAGAVTAGANTVRFRFNQNGGDSSGFRVLRLNFRRSDGSSILSDSTFTEEDPDQWSPPKAGSGDIAEGRRLWSEASLLRDPISRTPIRARCSSCHAQDGRDLKYFNYSNESIIRRSEFHGLSTTAGEQIASYIRTLNVINPGRPWNPPYQPGSGIDSRPVTEWAAGAGLNAVLDEDNDTLSFIPSTAYPSSANLSAREIPIAMQLLDWNHWLPQVHPTDAYGSSFDSSQFSQSYGRIRSMLRYRSSSSFLNALGDISSWDVRRGELIRNPSNWTAESRRAVYSASLWKIVKLWEMMQEFELEEFGKEIFGAQADRRAWWDHDLFLTSPNMLNMPEGPGLGNGERITRDYFAYVWYHLQLLLNNSNKKQNDNNPIDWPYTYGFIKAFGYETPQAGLTTLWVIKAFQISDNGKGPNISGTNNGWQWRVADISRLVHGDYAHGWTKTPASTRTTVYSALLRTWLDQVKEFTPFQFYSGGHASSGERVGSDFDGSFGDRIWYSIPRFRHYGVSQTMINEFADWAKTVWPSNDWNLVKSATCSGNVSVGCSSDR